jgi:hypothetical protein
MDGRGAGNEYFYPLSCVLIRRFESNDHALGEGGE